jgi:hypothetical protein
MGTAIDPTNGCQKTTIAMEQASSGKESGYCNQHVTRSKLKKNGTYTLLKMQVTIFPVKSERSGESGDVAINESSGRVVCASFCFANHRLRHLDLIQTASLLFIPDSEVYQGIANEISLFRWRSRWS